MFFMRSAALSVVLAPFAEGVHVLAVVASSVDVLTFLRTSDRSSKVRLYPLREVLFAVVS